MGISRGGEIPSAGDTRRDHASPRSGSPWRGPRAPGTIGDNWSYSGQQRQAPGKRAAPVSGRRDRSASSGSPARERPDSTTASADGGASAGPGHADKTAGGGGVAMRYRRHAPGYCRPARPEPAVLALTLPTRTTASLRADAGVA